MDLGNESKYRKMRLISEKQLKSIYDSLENALNSKSDRDPKVNTLNTSTPDSSNLKESDPNVVQNHLLSSSESRVISGIAQPLHASSNSSSFLAPKPIKKTVYESQFQWLIPRKKIMTDLSKNKDETTISLGFTREETMNDEGGEIKNEKLISDKKEDESASNSISSRSDSFKNDCESIQSENYPVKCPKIEKREEPLQGQKRRPIRTKNHTKKGDMSSK